MTDADPTVLVVDDEEDVRVVLGRLLDREGYGVALAADGASALDAVAGQSPDVVLLDVRMPGDIDGFDVCRRLRSDPATRLLPVVIITGFHARSDRLLGIEAGSRSTPTNCSRACARSSGSNATPMISTRQRRSS
jgi:two-component system cell cycle response regulator